MQESRRPLPCIAPLDTQATPWTLQFGMDQHWPSLGMSWQEIISKSYVYPQLHLRWHPTTTSPPLRGCRDCWRHSPTRCSLDLLTTLHRTHSPLRSERWYLSRLPTCILSWTGRSTRGRSGSKLEELSSTTDAKRSARCCSTGSDTLLLYEKTPAAHRWPCPRSPPSEP